MESSLLKRSSVSLNEGPYFGDVHWVILATQSISKLTKTSWKIRSRNVKTAPSTPEAEHHSFGRHAGSTSQLEMTAPITITKKSSKSSDGESGQKSPRKGSSSKMKKSRNDKFHKLFQCLPKDEAVLNAYSCAYIGDILLQGYLYISKNWFCFYSKILGHEKLIEIPVSKVVNISREKTAFFIPNAIGIKTNEEKYVFGSLMSRDNTYKLMWSVLHAVRATEGITSKDDADLPDVAVSELDGGISGTEADLVSSVPLTKARLRITPNSSCASEESEEVSLCEANDITMTSGHLSGQAKEAMDVSAKRPNGLRGSSSRKGHMSNHISQYDYRRVWSLLHKTLTWVWSLPRTSLLLLICSIMAVLLVISAMMLSYKLLLLQATIQNTSPPELAAHLDADAAHQSIYHLHNQYHTATIERFHQVLRANIQLLGQVYESLKMLKNSPPSASCIQDKEET